jgi:Flp pilus assembly protein TadG
VSGAGGPIRTGRDRGSATAEIALALPALVLLVLAGVTTVAGVGAQLRCVDAAREGARAAARGEPAGHASRVAADAAPADSAVVVSYAGEDAIVTVSAHLVGLSRLLPDVRLTARAVARREPGVPPGGGGVP